MNLSVTTTEHGGLTVVSAGGEIDVYTAPRLRDALDQQIAMGRMDLVIDLSGVTFIDSTGLGVLVGRLRYLRNHEGTLQVVTQSERVLRVFGITGLDTVFPVHATLDAAVAAMEPLAETDDEAPAQADAETHEAAGAAPTEGASSDKAGATASPAAAASAGTTAREGA